MHSKPQILFPILTAIAIADMSGDQNLALEVFEKGKKYFEEQRPNGASQSTPESGATEFKR